MSNKENLLLRIKAVIGCTAGKASCTIRIVGSGRIHARRIFGINYTAYASCLRHDVSHLSDRPEVTETVCRLDGYYK